MQKSYPQKRRTFIANPDLKSIELPVAFFDADNTLRRTRSGKPSPHGRHDVIVFAHAIDKLKELVEKGYVLAIVSNQAGIELGFLSSCEVEEALHETMRVFAEHGIIFNYYDYADRRDKNRKPEPEMAWRLERKLHQQGLKIAWHQSFMVGDAAWKNGKDIQPDGTPGSDHANSDRRFAENIAIKYPGFGFFHPRHFFSDFPVKAGGI